ncbi:insulinase family protein [Sphingorhabdus soli]|uniref:Insulinase family protein n=1 Tax=Flavisphingopyxis soli TaxID=2601267 RepID=A0A5C6U9F9_9SPHN|nr:M16 family metallopeptidase [Sphingorhabdus soli]TXC68801.1 insulinase family protein [Sphingorhabdus soli]
MNFRPFRFTVSLALLAGLPLAVAAPLAPAYAQQAAEAAPTPSLSAKDDWLYAGTDIPRDAGWQFGTLPNGLRYAVRNNGSPPGQVSIRVRIDAGSLMERDSERGFAHFLEHLSFRGSRLLGDGDTKRIWQRLGAAFGSDTNASTTPTSTVYKLDLPSATAAGLDEGMKTLAAMIEAPNLDAKTIDSERGVVLSELRENAGPQARVSDAIHEHVFAGQLLADRVPIGTEQSLGAATPAGLAAFHQRWYRPDTAVVAIAGDGDPAVFARLIAKYFGDWKATGARPTPPDFGDPQTGLPIAKVISEPTQPNIVTLNYLRPWRPVTDSVAYTQTLYHDFIALRIVNRRLEQRARAGGSYVLAQVGEDSVSRSAMVTSVNILPAPATDWAAALKDVRGVIADALANPPSQAEIDREYDEMDVVMTREVENAQNQPGTELVDDLLNSVDIGETVSDPGHHRVMFRSSRPLATPQHMLAVIQKLFSGDVVRAFVSQTTPPEPGTEARLAKLVTEPVAADGSARSVARTVTVADLPALGRAGRIVERSTIPVLNLQTLKLANGISALVFDNDVEPDKIRVRVRFGGGRRAMSPTEPNLLWTGDSALVQSGIGKLDLRDLESLMTGRLLGMGFDVTDGAFEFSAETNSADFADQLRLIAAKLDHPGWDDAPVKRTRVVELTSFDSSTGSPSAVLDRFLASELHPGDLRFASPDRAQVDRLTPKAFRRFWAPKLAAGPVEVMIFGDLSKVDQDKLLAETFGALKPRSAPLAGDGTPLSFPKPDPVPTVLRHSGDANQAAAMIAWKTSGGLDDIREARQLDVLAEIFNDRLFDRLRAAQGASYSPSVGSNWPRDFSGGGYIMAASLVRPQDVDAFYGYARDIARELMATPVSADELNRTITPLKEMIYRASSSNAFFMNELEGASSDPRNLAALRSYVTDTESATPAVIQKLARKYLANDGWSMVVLPKDVALSSVWTAPTQPMLVAGDAESARPTAVQALPEGR